jgi:uncharacterized protein (DUF1778 family)
MDKKKESRVVLTDDQHDTLTDAAAKAGMALSTYLRYCALQAAKSEQG